MSKQCEGKFHGKGIKLINDDETYCEKCKQNMLLKKKKKIEIGSIIITGLVGVGSIIAAKLGKKKRDD